ncbi:GNAT family N-acetyltransferase [Pedobacter sp. UBA4863]|uniref:GNAT family N-acetyltransferase n=1 Tax=Pedobacter sp. UBA4863 TaxID=1947060 RepID=UPI0025CCA156|nr:GNAT family N-acetyltransferase [Pedobacter sp. UBA4863]
MQNIKYNILAIANTDLINTIAYWYKDEWNLPIEETINMLKGVILDPAQFHMILEVDGVPVATGGLYEKVAILNLVPSLKKHKNWLALVYTVPNQRKKGYASLLCKHIEKIAKLKGIEKLHLFTHTAETLYHTLNWIVVQRINHNDKSITIMEKKLA